MPTLRRPRLTAALILCLVSWLARPSTSQAYTYAGQYTFTARWNEWGR